MVEEAQKRLQRGKILLFQRRYEGAEAELRLALAGQVDRALALYWLAWAQAHQGKLAEAEVSAGRSIAEDPERGEGYHALALVMRKRGQLTLAEQAGRRALEKDPKSSGYRSELAWILLIDKRLGEALALVEEGLQDQPDAVDLHCARTEALLQLRRYDDAKSSAMHTLSLDPADATSKAQLGEIAFVQQSYEAAQQHFAEALRLNPTYRYARNGLLNALRHRYWYHRMLLPENSVKLQWHTVALVYGTIIATTLVRPAPLVERAVVIGLAGLAGMVCWFWRATKAPLSALLLRLHRLGRAALSPDEKECSEFVGLLLGGAVLAFAAAIAGLWPGLFAVGLLFLILVAPVARIFQKMGGQRKLREAYAWLIFSIGCGGIAALAQNLYVPAAAAFLACALGAVGMEAITNAVWRIMVRPRKTASRDRE